MLTLDRTMLTDESRKAQAQELQEIWGRVSRQHFAAGSGCSCGFGGLVLTASDFELDIVEFLITDARKAGHEGVEPFVEAVSSRGPDRYSLPALISAIARADHPSACTPDELAFALQRLKTTLSSIENAHSKGRFACD